MTTSVLVATISAFAAIAVAVATYFFSRRRDREADWRKLKLDHYKEYVLALSGIVSRRSTTAAQARYSDAVNLMSLVAPRAVLQALYAFQDEISEANDSRTQRGHDESLAILLRAMRRDVQPTPPSDADLAFRLMDVPRPANNIDSKGLPERSA